MVRFLWQGPVLPAAIPSHVELSFFTVAVCPGNEAESFSRYSIFKAKGSCVKCLGWNNQESRRDEGWLTFYRRLSGWPIHNLDSDLYVEISLELTENPRGVDSLSVRVIVVIFVGHLDG
jgi:hypothetical protein